MDAAIAANACENVVEPMMNGMGGDLMAQVWHGPTNSLHGYNGAGRSPMSLSYGEMESELKNMVSAGGPAALFSRSWFSAAVGRLVCWLIRVDNGWYWMVLDGNGWSVTPAWAHATLGAGRMHVSKGAD